MSSMEDIFQIPPPLGLGVGYGIIVGVGALFAVGMSLTSWALSRYMNEVQDSEMFMTAKHSVKTGLTASAVVSSWTIAATLLTSTAYGYDYGVSGPFWYAAAASVQIMLFSVAAIELKRRAPNAQTFLQVAKVRYGTGVHVVFSLYSFIYQVIATVNLLVGGSAVFATMTGVNRDASCFLFPIGVVIYTLAGGIKATFITDWIHTVIIYVIMLMSIFAVYVTSDVIGSPDRMWDLLHEASVLHPVDGNASGSYLTMRSEGGGFIGLVFVGAGFAAAVDSQLFQKAIAADPRSTSNGYILGGICWFAIPFVLASTYGLAAAASEHLPQWPTYPNRMNVYELSSGIPMPYAALAIMGKGGSIGVLLTVFMAVTSAMSSETVATTALLAYNLYKAYIDPNATGKQIMTFSHWVTPGFGICTAAIAVGFNHAGFSVGFLVTAIGIFVDSAIIPMACTIMWRKQSKAAAIIAPLSCSVAGILAWVLTAYTHYGVVNIASLSANLPLVAGNMMALCGPAVLTPLITFTKPDHFDWTILKTQIKRGDDEHVTLHGHAVEIRNAEAHGALMHNSAEEREEQEALLKARNRSIYISLFLTLSFLILWPIPMYGYSYVFTKTFFRGWVVMLFLWAFFAALTITLLPIWEARGLLRTGYWHLTKRKRVATGVPDILDGTEARKEREDVASRSVRNGHVNGNNDRIME
ncbi:putative sodium/proline symporter [Pseudomassariella vexata]|uniref:Putative sodium/proline symporter n=1 Tax=Pseudomassariella vexata TaxID=1141098 RepID=A0A1Y2D8T8_9PEZI|nr:putative sodium/proline symporter [Pseudomassariella vexata]ORY55682.1 putative sodium/proline symporter [Pseudomassariella vexata]